MEENDFTKFTRNFSVQLNSLEYTKLKEAADSKGIRVTAYVKRAALMDAAQGEALSISQDVEHAGKINISSPDRFSWWQRWRRWHDGDHR